MFNVSKEKETTILTFDNFKSGSYTVKVDEKKLGTYTDVQLRNGIPFTLEGRAINEWELNELPRNLIPFAFDWGGNYLCLEKNSWQIIYYVRDVWSENISREANFKKNSFVIAKSFEEFLNYLEENPDD